MARRDKLFQKRVVDLIKWYDSDFKFPRRAAKDMLATLKNRIENHPCPGYNDSDNSEEESTPEKKQYPDQYWHCKICNVYIRINNKYNHLATKKHKNKESKQL